MVKTAWHPIVLRASNSEKRYSWKDACREYFPHDCKCFLKNLRFLRGGRGLINIMVGHGREEGGSKIGPRQIRMKVGEFT